MSFLLLLFLIGLVMLVLIHLRRRGLLHLLLHMDGRLGELLLKKWVIEEFGLRQE